MKGHNSKNNGPLNLYCLQMQGISVFSRTRVKRDRLHMVALPRVFAPDCFQGSTLKEKIGLFFLELTPFQNGDKPILTVQFFLNVYMFNKY